MKYGNTIKDAKKFDEVCDELEGVRNIDEQLNQSINDALADFYSTSNDELIVDFVEGKIMANNNKILGRIFGLDESVKGRLIENTNKNYELKASNIFKGEEKGIYPEYKDIKYLTESERIKYEVFVKDGKLIANGEELIMNQKVMFVMDKNGKIYCGVQNLGKFHHSSFLAGADVATAGEFKITNGILEISPKSGHYVPPLESLSQVIEELAMRGVCINKIKINRKLK